MLKVVLFCGKIIAAPIIVVILILTAVFDFIDSMTGWIFRGIAMIFFLTAILTWAFGLEPFRDVIWMIAASFGFYILPTLAAVCISPFLVLKTLLTSWVFHS